MSLHNGLDTVAIISGGVYTKNYSSSAEQPAMNALYASRGYFESVPEPLTVSSTEGLMRFGLNLTFH